MDLDQEQSDPDLDISSKQRCCMFVCAMNGGYNRYWITM